MAKHSRAIPSWAVYPGIALIAFVVWRKFSTGHSASNLLDWLPGSKKFHSIGKPNTIRIDVIAVSTTYLRRNSRRVDFQ